MIACSKPPITIKSHNLHDVDIRGAMGEIVLYLVCPFLGPLGCASFGLSLASPFLSPLGWFWPSFFHWFFVLKKIVVRKWLWSMGAMLFSFSFFGYQNFGEI